MNSSIVICDRVDYLKEANKQLSNKNVYKEEVEFKEKMLTEFAETSNRFLRALRLKFKKMPNLGYKRYLRYTNFCLMSQKDQLF